MFFGMVQYAVIYLVIYLMWPPPGLRRVEVYLYSTVDDQYLTTGLNGMVHEETHLCISCSCQSTVEMFQLVFIRRRWSTHLEQSIWRNPRFVSDILSIHTRSSATAEKQRVSCTCLPRLANWWSCNAHNTAEPQWQRTRTACQDVPLSIISDIQTLWFKKYWPKTHFVMK